MSALRLECTYEPPVGRGHGTMRLRLVNAGREPLRDHVLVLTSVVQLTPPTWSPTRLRERTSGHHELAPPLGAVLAPGAVWDLGPLACGHRPAHANDGPASAFVRLGDDSTRPVRVGVTARVTAPVAKADAPRPLQLASDGDAVGRAWAAMTLCERRVAPRQHAVLGPSGDPVSVEIVDGLGDESFELAADGDGVAVRAGSERAVRYALATVVRRRRAGADGAGSTTHSPRFAWRGLHVDLARQFVPAADVDDLIERAAWLRLDRLHLHLTDDEAWRLEIPTLPPLTKVGAWRGDGLPIPALLGSGAEAYGGWYDAATVGRWVGRAGELGVELIPEIDLPGHSFAALAALPMLRDSDDTSAATSVQHFVDNVIVPGVGTTRPFLDAVLGHVADVFPSPWIHVGGDEVADRAWSGSPAAQRYAAQRGVEGSEAIGAELMRDVIALVRSHGRRVGVWQEAADAGALHPGDGYVVAWKSAADARRLAAAGHDVVAAPAPEYYLDIAVSDDWSAPGTSWAGTSPLEVAAGLDVTAGWSDDERAGLLGAQMCLWTEHAPDRPAREALIEPRLTVIADSWWTS